ncbi:MAG: hypothetical protein IPO04_21445 [Cytophagaceae bacterium]|nr:hypothetical protein [Cytophagaceae bacterium]
MKTLEEEITLTKNNIEFLGTLKCRETQRRVYEKGKERRAGVKRLARQAEINKCCQLIFLNFQ